MIKDLFSLNIMIFEKLNHINQLNLLFLNNYAYSLYLSIVKIQRYNLLYE